jgi:drug/metabolite transporter (DMT)-like permease
MSVAMAGFVSSDTLMKLVAENLPSGQALFVRGMMMSALVVSVVAARGELRRWRVAADARVAGRAGFEVVAALTYLPALPHVALATAYAAVMAIPLLTLPIAALVLGERVGWRRALAIIVGFIGVGLVIKPDVATIDVWALLLMISALFCGLRDVTTRTIPPVVPSTLVTAATIVLVTIVSLPFGLVQGWRSVSVFDALAMAGSAVLIAGATQLLILAMRTGEVSIVSAFRYTSIIWALAFGFALWGDVPDAAGWAGIAIIVGAGLYTLHRERLRTPIFG